MKTPLDKIYRFGAFRFDAGQSALYHNDRFVKEVKEKPLHVLAVLLENPKRLTTHDEIIERVWRDNPLGVNSAHIAQYISKLRKVFAELAPGDEYIETVKGRGYSFIADVATEENDGAPELFYEASEFLPAAPEFGDDFAEKPVFRSSFPKYALAVFALAAICAAGFAVYKMFSESDEQEIRSVVEQSQKYESMVLYSAPATVKPEDLQRYWLDGGEFETELDVTKIRAGIDRLIREKKFYGGETKAEQFEIQTVEINDARDFATVRTLEKWFIAEYMSDGALHKNKTVGPYFVVYSLQKKNGRWLIEKSSTARAKPSPAVLPQ